MSERIQAPRGTFDVLPEQASQRAEIERRARELLQAAGYARIETPAFEQTELFSRGVGASTDIVTKEMFSFTAGERSYTLRPEGTAPVCRAYVEHGMHKLPAPVKLWYLGPFFRHERAQAGRHRQFWQVGAEALGSDDPALDAESIALADALLRSLGARDLTLRLGSLGSPDQRAAYRDRLQAHLRANIDRVSPEVAQRIDVNPLRAFDADDPGTRAVMADAPRLLDELAGEDAEHFAQVRALLDAVEVPYVVDDTLVRGLDYYTRTVFEFTSTALGAQSGVGGGGRYDGLVEQLGGPPTPGFGWAAGIERIMLARDGGDGAPAATGTAVDLYVAPGDDGARTAAFTIARSALQAGLACELELAGRSRKGRLKHADRLQARYVARVEATHAELWDRESGATETVDNDAVVHAVLRGRRDL